MNTRQRLVHHVQELELLERLKKHASDRLKDGYDLAAAEGFDRTTLKVVLKLRKMTPDQRRERRALEAIYLAALEMLDGDSLPDEARRRLDGEPRNEREGDPPPSPPDADDPSRDPSAQEPSAPQDPFASPPPEQPPLIIKDPDEARTEGAEAAAAGKRVYDNPYPAGDPCRAAWDEGWCSQSKSHGMDTPTAFQRRTPAATKPEKREKRDGDGDADGDADGSGDDEKGGE